ncbi:major facilitator superfamily MFS_1 [Caldithrix abyssi DSM 13497]|uniref:Dipeptide/tripeptide permease n=1 Tax=Caldithrix abyssi DSM 13497 TaxID=880073 RepID=H1XUJ3_CALAY|nr:MFS transporter [Caldithrix abyssi]APF16853.1 Dipeptide/tripeptide permease [Caldithrix abyssi DSM 13497]EHO40492.1 major facilitator superfamily MFS_1 [Caldithrix abyssi DSM 13497]
MDETKLEEAVEKKTLKQAVQDAFKELGDTFVAFVNAPKALWAINIPYIIEGLVYFGILTILGKFCSENVGLTDPQAGWIYSFVTGGITFAMLILGGVSDKLGVRLSLIVAFAVMFFGRALVGLSGTIPLGSGLGSPMFFVMFGGLFLMVLGYGLYQPASYAGVKRYTNPQTAAMGYAVIYGLMNLGAFFSGFISPLVRHRFESTFPPNGLPAVFWVYAGLTLLSLLITVFILTRKTDQQAVEQIARETTEMTGEDEKATPKSTEPEAKINNIPLAIYAMVTLGLLFLVIMIRNDRVQFNLPLAGVALSASFLLTIWEYLRHRPDHPFRDLRFVAFIFMLIPVQTLFAHNWLTIPYYLDRAFHGSVVSQYFELFSNINPILIFVLAPVVAGLTASRNIYKMMIYGTLVMAAPTFLLALGPNVVFFLAYILIMSIGEAMWQPRFLQWIAEIAPEGKTGAYMGIGQLPWFLTKVLTGLYSGYFVEKYIPRPETGLPIQSGKMWFIYGLIAISTTIFLVLAKGWMMKGMKQKAS